VQFRLASVTRSFVASTIIFRSLPCRAQRPAEVQMGECGTRGAPCVANTPRTAPRMLSSGRKIRTCFRRASSILSNCGCAAREACKTSDRGGTECCGHHATCADLCACITRRWNMQGNHDPAHSQSLLKTLGVVVCAARCRRARETMVQPLASAVSHVDAPRRPRRRAEWQQGLHLMPVHCPGSVLAALRAMAG